MMRNKLAVTICGAVVLSVGSSCAAQKWVQISDEGARISVQTEGIQKFEGLSSAVFSPEGGRKERIGGRNCKRISPRMESVCPTPFGEADLTVVQYGKENSPYKLTVRVKRLKDFHAFTLQGIFHNGGDQDVQLDSFDLFDALPGGGSFTVTNPDEWLVTPLMQATDAEPLSKMAKNLNEAALFRNPQGNGFLVGPVGPAEAYTSVEVRNGGLKSWVQMDRILVRAGESRRSEEMIFCFEPGKTATDIWTRWVAVTHGVRLNKGPRYGWCSWYDRTTRIDADHVLSVTKTIGENPNVFGKGVIQIDDGYQKMDGDWSGNAKFPMGMAAVAKEIRKIGCVPGVWFAPLMIGPEHPFCKEHPDALQKGAGGISRFMNANPFHPDGANWINSTHPESKKFLAKIIRDARDRGYGYIKIDFNGIGGPFLDRTKTRLQVFRELYTIYRGAAGDEMYILSCLGQPNRGVVGFVDAARVGPDSHPANFHNCLKSVLRFQIFDNVWWQNDPDVSYLAKRLKSRRVGFTPQGEGMWRTWHNVVTLVGGAALISEPIDQPDCKEVWRNYEIMRPSSCEPARLLTLGASAQNSIFGFAAERAYGDFAVYNLYNSEKGKNAISLDFPRAGLPMGTRCAVFDFWKNRVIGYAVDRYATPALDQYSSSLLRFTPILGKDPILVGSNLHLSIGATEVKNIRTTKSSLEVTLTDAGAQTGSLTFYSEVPLAAGTSRNCRISKVERVGENLWRADLEGRQWGQTQTLSLKIVR